ncbi:MAG: DNA-protecting protein DprA, partial [Candidatus Heimdallarchaeota archaeon]|nr:DNA-protecting protein DprA [Candidatus Heimdallarchaeota archaeon]
GIDTAAHTGALTASGCTSAVLGSGLAKIYPWENEALANKISCDGSVISEFPMQTPPLAGNFPRRNRIISGLSVGIVVVEASSRSGALITSRCALEQGREVFAVPGKIGTPQAVGTNRLIQQGAKLVCSVEDIFEELHLPLRKLVHAEEQHSDFRIDSFTDEEKRVFDLLNDEPCYIDNVVSQTNLAYDQSAQVLLALECKKVIRRLPGNYFIKII